jgi:hypothetical protein
MDLPLHPSFSIEEKTQTLTDSDILANNLKVQRWVKRVEEHTHAPEGARAGVVVVTHAPIDPEHLRNTVQHIFPENKVLLANGTNLDTSHPGETYLVVVLEQANWV